MKNGKELSELVQHLVETKSVEALTTQERLLVIKELGSIECFQLMQEMETLHPTPAVEPDPLILNQLSHRLKEIHIPIWKRCLMFEIPAYAVCILLLGVIFAVYVIVQRPQLNASSAVVVKQDTVYVASVPDTIVIEKVVYKMRVIIEKKENPYSVVNSIPTPKHNEGVNVREREELEVLLVSGS